MMDDTLYIICPACGGRNIDTLHMITRPCDVCDSKNYIKAGEDHTLKKLCHALAHELKHHKAGYECLMNGKYTNGDEIKDWKGFACAALSYFEALDEYEKVVE